MKQISIAIILNITMCAGVHPQFASTDVSAKDFFVPAQIVAYFSGETLFGANARQLPAEPSRSNMTATVERYAALSTNQSTYTELSGPPCDRDKQIAEVTSEHECPGVSGYRLLVTNVDDRQSITVITPDKRKFDLGLNAICGGGFCSVGQKAEWRLAVDGKGRRTPVALIVRVNCQSLNLPSKNVSYLSISKLTQNQICVTAYIPPMRDANVQARAAADSALAKPCLRPQE
jgi:hypothetical protein